MEIRKVRVCVELNGVAVWKIPTESSTLQNKRDDALAKRRRVIEDDDLDGEELIVSSVCKERHRMAFTSLNSHLYLDPQPFAMRVP